MQRRQASLSDRFVNRALSWRLRTRTIALADRPLIMGIVNVTPDSFSDGGMFLAPEKAIELGLKLGEEGADILDIGGESTRPYSDPVSLAEELARTEQVVRGLAERTALPISIDTSKAQVAKAAIDCGAEIINDVTGFEGDPLMSQVAVDSGAGVCVMHMQGDPQTMQDNPTYDNVVEDIFEYLRRRKEHLISCGIELDRICLDPGIGFGKTHQHNLTLAAACGRFHDLGQPLLVGHSRKGFIAKLIGDKECDRSFASVGVGLALARQGVQILRVHDVAAHRQAWTLFAACGGVDGKEARLT